MIKDQCSKCRKRNSEDCQALTSFDGNPCANYLKGIDLSKHAEPSTEERIIHENLEDTSLGPNYTDNPDLKENDGCDIITREYLKENTSIRGWLVFFLIIVGLGGIFSFFYPFATFNIQDYSNSYVLASVDIFSGITYLFVAGYTIYSFLERQPNAVFIAKTYLVLVFFSNVLQLIGGEFEESGLGSLSHTIRAIINGVIWFTYLCKSKQVNEIIPKCYRRRKTFDYYMLGAIFIIPIVLIAIGIAQINNEINEQRYNMINSTELNFNEYTDGISIITCPDDFTCEEKEINIGYNQISKYYILESEYAYMTVISDYIEDHSFSNFRSILENWKDSDLVDYYSEITFDEDSYINGYPYFYRLTKYEIGLDELSWRFAIVFDTNKNKAILISAYDYSPEYKYGPDNYLKDFISNIRF